MKRILNYWRETLCLFSFCVFAWSISRSIFAPPDNSFTALALLIIGFSSIAFFIYLFRWLWRNKWRYKYCSIKEKLLEKATRFFARFFEKLMKKWSMGNKKKNVIGGNTRIIFDDTLFKRDERSGKKALRYKQLKSDRERLRFLYRSMIMSKIRSGERIRSYDTPLELKTRSENSENADKLFSMYIGARYDDRTLLDGNEIQYLKDSLSQEFTIR